MTEYRFVEQLPDLIQPPEYQDDPDGKRVRLRITVSADGVEVLGDAMRVATLEQMMKALDPESIEQMLCG